MKKGFLLVFILTLCVLGMYAQTRVITGTVSSSEDGLPIPGVSVSVKDATLGTITDRDGKYSLKIPETSNVILFSFIGLKTQEIVLSGEDRYDVIMSSDLIDVEEVVVTALGVTREKKSLTYSATEVNSGELLMANETNIVNALSGKVAGVQVSNSSGMVGSSSRITIRGVSSLNGENQPLFIIDGVPFNNQEFQFDEGDVDQNLFYGSAANTGIDIDPNQIESMTVLKGASATALYGSRAANGVILITTKGGITGKDEPIISVSSRFGLDKIRPFKTTEDYSLGTDGSYVDGVTQKSSWVWGAKLDTMDVETYDRWDFFDIGKTYENSVSIQGGTAKTGYFASFSALNQDGTTPSTSLDRYSALAKFDVQVGEKVKLNAKLDYTSTENNRLSEGNALTTIMWTILAAPPNYNMAPGTDENGEQRLWRSPTRNNPYWLAENTGFVDKRDRFVPTFSFDYSILSWMKLKGNFGIDYYSADVKYYENKGSRGPYPDGRVIETNRINREINSDVILLMEKDLKPKLHGSFLFGHNINSRYYHFKSVQGTDFIIPSFYNLSNTTIYDPSEGTIEKRLTSLYGQATFTYNEYLYLTITGRNDWSSTLPKSNNSYFYPSVSTGLIFSDLLDLDSNWLSFGKIRLSYAKVGNDADAYVTTTSYYKANPGDGQRGDIIFPFGGVGSYKESNIRGNPNLKPEISSEFEVGGDIRFFNNRLGFDIAYYNKTSKDQIFSAPSAPETGFGSQTVNAAEIENKGIELLLTATPVKINGFKWDVSINYSKNKNKVLSLTEGVSSIRLAGFTQPGIFIMADQPYGVIWGSYFERNDNGDILVDDDGYPLIADESGPIGNVMPDWVGGIRNTFSWKGITISALIDTRQGGDIYNLDEYYMKAYGTSWLTRDRQNPIVFNGVRESDGAVNTTGITDYWDYWLYESASDEANVQDASFIRLRDVSIGYDVPKSLLGKTFIKGMNVTISGRNLWLKVDDSFTGSDPETSLYGSGNGQGITNFGVPSTKSVNFSIRLTL